MYEPKNGVWCRPELIVLLRSTPGEAVLTACKSETVALEGPGSQNLSCTNLIITCDPDPYCSNLTES